MYNDDENDFQYRYSGNDIPYNNGMSNNDMNKIAEVLKVSI